MTGFEVSSAYVGETGLAFDRQMMLIDDQGSFCDGKKVPTIISFQMCYA